MLTYMYILLSHQEFFVKKNIYIFSLRPYLAHLTHHCLFSFHTLHAPVRNLIKSYCNAKTSRWGDGPISKWVSCTPHYRFFTLILPYYYYYSNAHDIGKFFECFLYIIDGLTLLDSPMRYFFMSLFL